ncbi:uncharacterized protein IL334_004156 [Kwoniella shivajii]|uniref:Subtelomeric hrmA-associated cluster protein AFUB-079030/YDR124W-like helical bundle domain-containing protein n=1 Tax=Kwoniella shivajii TaxID=564305 RepID=A0ABZ1D1B0_9TREE|nr:hypothetical protein IL334_004156 [Kwoniella shivajii]
MPRIPVRTTPYHALPRCTRHYKSKRDLILRALGKASFINGSQFVIAWISPKGDTDIFASELLQSAVKDKEGGGVLNKKELEKEAARVKQEMVRRWDEIRRMEEKGEVPTLDEDSLAMNEGEVEEDVEGEVEGENDEELDGDKTLVDEVDLSNLDTPLKLVNGTTGLGISTKRLSPLTGTGSGTGSGMYSTFSTTNSLTPRSSTPISPMQTIILKPNEIENFYMERFTNLQQQTCKLVVKAWIKIIEPKKQMKFPYNKGEEFKPSWWPEGVKHREPDHLPKDERKLLLISIIRNASVNVARLQLSTAETSALISASKLAILREIYIVAKEEERRRQMGDTTSDLIIELPIIPQQTSNGSPEPAVKNEKRSHSLMSISEDNKENINTYELAITANGQGYPTHVGKKHKSHPRLPALSLSNHQQQLQQAQQAQQQLQQQQHQQYDSPYTTSPSPFAYAPQPQHHQHQHQHNQHLQAHVWGETRINSATSSTNSHLSPYAYATSDVHSNYSDSNSNSNSRSPNPDSNNGSQRQYQNQHHLAPLLNINTNTHSHSHSPTPTTIDSPAFPHSATIQTAPGSAPYYPQQQQQRSNQGGYMQQQQMEYLHQHQHQLQHHQQQQQPNETYGYPSPYLTDAWDGQYQQTV